MTSEFTHVIAKVTFLKTEEGGRQKAPAFRTSHKYFPHVVVQSPDAREATRDENGYLVEDYLGVQFIDDPNDYELGQTAEVKLLLFYHPRVDYSKLVPDATFTIREGGKIVGFGAVQSRHRASD
ncbi:MAG: hypothetical protein RID07_07020, partial [Lacipirellulaceae bacterium]